jgi:DNA-directed RNA polymerase specialized sigma subunit
VGLQALPLHQLEYLLSYLRHTSIFTILELESSCCSVFRQGFSHDGRHSSISGMDKRVPVYLGEQMRKVLSTLTPREEMILRMRFGIGRRAGQLGDLSRQFSLTRKRIRQIEMEALRKLREKTRCFYSELHHE